MKNCKSPERLLSYVALTTSVDVTSQIKSMLNTGAKKKTLRGNLDYPACFDEVGGNRRDTWRNSAQTVIR